MNFLRKMHNLWYKIKCKFYYKYNTVTAKTLSSTWNDRCDLLPHIMFAILDDFINKEKPGEIINWESDKEHSQAWKDMNNLLKWFHGVYLKFDEYEGLEFDRDIDNMWEEDDGSGFRTLKPSTEHDEKILKIVWDREAQMRKDLEEKLIELVKIRKWLWC